MVAALKLLVVEGDITHLERMAELLKQLKAEVRTIRDSAEAALMIHRQRFDGIFLDLDLPTLSGFHLARLVRESVSNQATPIAILTGREQEDAMHMSFSLGANYFLRKPADMQTLDALLKEIRKPIVRTRLRIVRVPLNRDVSCKVGAETLRGLIWNISQGGIELEVAGLKLGHTVRMSFVLPRPVIVIRAEGSVMWAHEGRQGLYFTEMSVEHQHAVQTYISSA